MSEFVEFQVLGHSLAFTYKSERMGEALGTPWRWAIMQ